MTELNERGQAIYDSLIEGRQVSEAHKAMALNAARMADTLDKIENELALNPNLTVINSQGTRTVNPLIAEARQITGALSQILSKLGVAALPDATPREKSAVDQLAERRAERRQRAAGGGSAAKNHM